jgi:hypothetical protein
MSLRIKSVISCIADDYICVVKHGESEFRVKLSSQDKLNANTECFFEMNYDNISMFETITNYDDNMSGIFSTENENEICIIGKISGIYKEVGFEIIDLYIQKGPEFIAIDKKEIPNLDYKIDDGIKIIVQNLVMYVHDINEF